MSTPPKRIALAVVLAILTLPITAYGISMISGVPAAYPEAEGLISPASDPALLVEATLLAVSAAAIVGSAVASLVRDHSARLAWIVAVFVSWPVAISVLPILPALLGQGFDVGSWCIDSCNPGLTAASPVSGVQAYGLSLVPSVFLLAVLMTPIGAVVCIVLAVGAVALARKGYGAGVVVVIMAGALLLIHSTSIGMAPVPFAVLVGGVTAWTLLTRPSPSRQVVAELAPPWAPPAG